MKEDSFFKVISQGKYLFTLALQESFIALAPFVILISFVLLFSRLPTYLGLHAWEGNSTLTALSTTLWGFLSLIVVISISYHFALRYNVERIVSVLLATAVFLTLQVLMSEQPSPPSLPINAGLRQMTTPIAAVFFIKILSPRFNISFDDCNIYACRVFKYIPTFFLAYVLLLAAGLALNRFWSALLGEGINFLFSTWSDGALLALRAILAQGFWFFGVHGQRMVNTLMDTSFLGEEIFPNLSYRQFYRLFAVSGGTGMGLSMLIAFYIAGRDLYNRKLAHVSAPFVVFNINTLLIYALPVVLNRFMLIPFLLTPLVTLSTAYLVLSVMPVTFHVAQVDWVIPALIDSWIVGGGDVRLVLLQGALISAGVFLYLPFIKRSLAVQSVTYHLDNLKRNLELTESLHVFRDLKLHRAQHEIIEANAKLDEVIGFLSRESLMVYYQPKVDAQGDDGSSFEALLRVKLSDGSISGPFFLQDLEDAGLSPAIDLWVCQEVKSHLQLCLAQNKGLNVSINLHPDTVNNSRIIERIIAIMEGMNVEFEIIERALLEGENVSVNLAKLRDHGFKVAIDDFGQGYSSYHTLSSVSIDVVKIDRSLMDLLPRPKGMLIWKHVIDLCHDLQIKTVAEGVETEEQVAALQSLGIDLMQGFYFSGALSISQVCQYQPPARSAVLSLSGV